MKTLVSSITSEQAEQVRTMAKEFHCGQWADNGILKIKTPFCLPLPESLVELTKGWPADSFEMYHPTYNGDHFHPTIQSPNVSAIRVRIRAK